MRAVVTALLITAVALVPASPAAGDSPEQVVPAFGIATSHTQGLANNHSYSMQVDTIGLNRLAGANVQLRCLGCKTRKLGRPQHRSRNARKYANLGWRVGRSNYIEVDVSRSGYTGRWLQLGLRRVHHQPHGASCFKLPGSGRRYECLLKLKSGCLQGGTTHAACPTGTPVQLVDQLPGAPVPHTNITSGPTGSVNSGTATFTYSSDSGTGYQCKLDDGDWLTCPSDQDQYTGLADGKHTFSVQAVLNDQPDPSPASRSWTVDTTPPRTTITAGPSGAVQGASGTFSYASSEGGSRFDCDFDSQGWKPCNGGRATFSYTAAAHSLAVRAIDAAGNIDPNPATTTWRRFPDDGTPFEFDDQDQGFLGHVENEPDWHGRERR